MIMIIVLSIDSMMTMTFGAILQQQYAHCFISSQWEVPIDFAF